VIRRPRRSIPAALTALVLLAGCVLIATGAIELLAGQRPLISYAAIANAAHRAHWNDLALAFVGGVAALLGLILLLTAILPGTPTVLPMQTADTDAPMDSGASRRSLRSTLRAAANSVDGVAATTLTLRRSAVAVTVRTHRTNTEGLADAVRSAIGHRLDQITPATRPTVRVKVTTTRSAS
jgi:hypothetical protein